MRMPHASPATPAAAAKASAINPGTRTRAMLAHAAALREGVAHIPGIRVSFPHIKS